MTQFIYLADSHSGANPMGYQQQRAYPEKLAAIVDALRQLIKTEKGIDFVLHGGDMINATSEENIRAAALLFTLDLPVYLCLGNHDLTAPDALQQWLRLAPQFFPGDKPEYSIETEDCLIHVVPNHWDTLPYYWEKKQFAHFCEEQLTFLNAALSSNTDRPHFLSTHTPVFGLPPEQTGLEEPYHFPNEELTETLTNLTARHSHLHCVLGAHNHLNMHVKKDDVHFVTASAIVETPFEFKLFDVSKEAITMQTVTLANRMDGTAEYDFNKTFVQGRGVDRGFSFTLA